MRRLSLLFAAVVLSAVGFAGAAHASPFAWSSADAGASIRQAGYGDSDGDELQDFADKCPNEPGPDATMGCPLGGPDGDGDLVIDSADACPTVSVASTDGCPTWGVNGNGYLKQGNYIVSRCSDGPGDACKARGTASLTLTQSAKRKLGVKSALVGRWDFERPCGHSLTCAVVELGSALNKRVKAVYRNNDEPVYVTATLTVEMISPRKETRSKKIRLGVLENGGPFVLKSSNSK